jgi:hypothetical protein
MSLQAQAEDVRRQMIRKGASDAQLAVNQVKGLIDVQLSLAHGAVNHSLLQICTIEDASRLKVPQAKLETASARIRKIVDETFAEPMKVIGKVLTK